METHVRSPLALAFLSLGACSGGEASPPPAPAPVASPTPTAPAEPPSPRLVTQGRHSAVFVDDELDGCIDFVVTFTVPPDLPDWSPPAREESSEPSAEAVTIARPCPEQFSTHQELASCTTVTPEQPVGREPRVRFSATTTSRSYRFASALSDDRRMRSCLTRGGDWHAVAAGSPEHELAELEYERDQLRPRRVRR
jgi:hypothetical protein